MSACMHCVKCPEAILITWIFYCVGVQPYQLIQPIQHGYLFIKIPSFAVSAIIAQKRVRRNF